ncbi:conjugal transfer protein TraF [Pseudomonas sp. ChxA]|jgi:thiol-disulfide isomerase/thioredoxin|uniref:conjugal transfer protein TraF n=1 Tax=Pseudomonas TaxID=286 RepID=UPI0009970045|nr:MULTISPECIES: conjugal transfer protein TraF [Pseudomonas]MBF6043484.1 conjugal transfer protein TraF [Pseudomonas mucoides]MBJ2202706.1 conjugal transfer protein TraF [Pseudomonas carnis]MBX9405686.1 conjugal transfer protein TraF [Pseudomonas baetica]MDL2189733.1 conjugal transfer protein TraF [Pseudomonas sp. ChxA]NMX83735.1 conjugal transfer protein TraF [Pseudomonas sp. WS 5503]
MKTSIKISLAFLVGCFVSNAPFVLSDASSPNEALSNAIAVAMAKVDKYNDDRQNAEIDKLPNILDCQNMDWMKNCSELNRNAKKNPQAPMRMIGKNGVEFNFQPGTPSAVINLQLNQTPEAASELVSYMDKTWGEYHKSAELYKMAMWQNGDLKNIKGLDAATEKAKEVKYIDTDNVSMSVFVESTCPVCEKQLQILSTVQQKYPKLKIKIFQLDGDRDAFTKHVTQRGLSGRVLSREERISLQKLGVTSWPISWIDNTKVNRRKSIVGNRTLRQLEDHFQAMTYIQPEKKGA